MPSFKLRLTQLVLAALSFSSCSRAVSIPDADRQILRRGIITQDKLDEAYDFIIAGGGTAGLVLASRLSEDPNVSVLVLEAGQSGDEVAERVSHPGNTYYQSLVGTDYDWGYQTISQSHAGGNRHYWPRGKLLGGSSAINGLYWTRPSKTEIDTIAELNKDDPDAAKWWTWDAFLPAMKKSETFDAPEEDVKQKGHIEYNTESFGNSGPTHIGYPGVTFDLVGQWHTALQKNGVPANPDSAGGNNIGSFVSTSNIRKANWTRSTSRTSYIDPLPPRSNLAILPRAQVTRIIWKENTGGDLVANGVEYASTSGSSKKTVKVKREVILSAGAIGSPPILQLSGVGPKDVLEAAKVNVSLELPGVGAHLQDHLAWGLVWSTDAETSASVRASGNKQSKTDIFLSYVNSATAYVDLQTLVGNYSTQFAAETKAQYDKIVKTVPGQDPTVLAGHKVLYDTIIDKFWSGPVGQVEILLTMASPGSITVQSAIQHPLSFGRVAITSTNAFEYPSIDPQYFANPSDRIMMREGLKLARKVGQAYGSFGNEIQPGSKVKSDADWDSVTPYSVKTEFHPSSTSAMLPRNLGGVVDPRLRVYGTTNVRVVDASVFPFGMACHLNGPTVGLAEQAANIIKEQYSTPPSPSSPSGSGAGAEPTGSGNGAITFASMSSIWTLSALFFTTAMFTVL